jgi:2-dehydropantoate 2-reductase
LTFFERLANLSSHDSNSDDKSIVEVDRQCDDERQAIFMRTLIYGAGAIGGWLGARLSQRGDDVTLLARSSNLHAMQMNGITLLDDQGNKTMTPVNAISPEEPASPFDLIIVTLKSTQLAATAPDWMQRLKPQGSLLMIQNGLPWWYFEELPGPWKNKPIRCLDPELTLSMHVPTHRLVGATIVRPVIQIGPATYRIPDDPSPVLRIGEVHDPSSLRLEKIKGLLHDIIPTQAVADIRHAKWTKLMRNLVWNTLCTLSQSSPHRFALNDLGRRLVQNVLNEGTAVAKSIGQTINIDAQAELASVIQATGHTPSMLQDVRAGRALEIDAIVKCVIEIGQWTKTPTPTLETLCALLEIIDATVRDTHQGVGLV